MVKIAAQEWLTKNYENKKEEITSINFVMEKIRSGERDKELGGELSINGYPNLKEIDLSEAKGLTKLTIEECPKVEKISLFDNKITEIVGLEDLNELKELNCGKTEISEIDISNNTKLNQLVFHGNKREIEIIGFEDVVEKLKFWNSIDGIAFPWEKISEKELGEVAEELKINEDDLEDKSVEQIKELVKGRIEELQKIRDKVNEIPELINEVDGKTEVNEERLEELSKLNPGEINDLIKDLKELGIEVKNVAEEIKKLRKKGESSGNYVELLEHHIRKRLGEGELTELNQFITQIEQPPIQVIKNNN